MSKLKRAKSVEKSMTVKEIVLLHIEESRKYPSLIAHAQTFLGRPASTTLCDRIEAAVAPTVKGLPERDRVDRIRSAQRDGLFLARLGLECNSTLLRHDREWELEAALISALLSISIRARREPDQEADLSLPVERWVRVAQNFVRRLTSHLEAVRSIEREYFNGVAVLYRDAEAGITERIHHTGELARRVEGLLEAEEIASDQNEDRVKKDPRKATQPRLEAGERSGSRRAAAEIVAHSKVWVLRDMGEVAKSERVLDEYLSAQGVLGA